MKSSHFSSQQSGNSFGEQLDEELQKIVEALGQVENALSLPISPPREDGLPVCDEHVTLLLQDKKSTFLTLLTGLADFAQLLQPCVDNGKSGGIASVIKIADSNLSDLTSVTIALQKLIQKEYDRVNTEKRILNIVGSGIGVGLFLFGVRTVTNWLFAEKLSPEGLEFNATLLSSVIPLSNATLSSNATVLTNEVLPSNVTSTSNLLANQPRNTTQSHWHIFGIDCLFTGKLFIIGALFTVGAKGISNKKHSFQRRIDLLQGHFSAMVSANNALRESCKYDKQSASYPDKGGLEVFVLENMPSGYLFNATVGFKVKQSCITLKGIVLRIRNLIDPQ